MQICLKSPNGVCLVGIFYKVSVDDNDTNVYVMRNMLNLYSSNQFLLDWTHYILIIFRKYKKKHILMCNYVYL